MGHVGTCLLVEPSAIKLVSSLHVVWHSMMWNAKVALKIQNYTYLYTTHRNKRLIAVQEKEGSNSL